MQYICQLGSSRKITTYEFLHCYSECLALSSHPASELCIEGVHNIQFLITKGFSFENMFLCSVRLVEEITSENGCCTRVGKTWPPGHDHTIMTV